MFLVLVVMLVSLVSVIGDLDGCLEAELYDLSSCSTESLKTGDYCYDSQDNGFMYEIVKDDYGSGSWGPYYDYKNVRVDENCDLVSFEDSFNENGGDPDDNSGGQKGDKYVFYERVKEMIGIDFSCNGNIVTNELESCENVISSGLYDFCYDKTFYVGMTSANRYQLYYYTGGNGWSNAKLNDNCQLELFEDSFYEGGHPNDDETDGLKGDNLWYYNLVKETSQSYLGTSIISEDNCDVSDEDPSLLFQKNPSNGDFYDGYWHKEDCYIWYNIEGGKDIKTESYGYCEDRSSGGYCQFKYYDGAFYETNVYELDEAEAYGYTPESEYIGTQIYAWQEAIDAAERGATADASSAAYNTASYTQQGCKDQNNCQEIDEVWRVLSPVVNGGGETYWMPKDENSGSMVSWETIYHMAATSSGTSNYASEGSAANFDGSININSFADAINALNSIDDHGALCCGDWVAKVMKWLGYGYVYNSNTGGKTMKQIAETHGVPIAFNVNRDQEKIDQGQAESHIYFLLGIGSSANYWLTELSDIQKVGSFTSVGENQALVVGYTGGSDGAVVLEVLDLDYYSASEIKGVKLWAYPLCDGTYVSNNIWSIAGSNNGEADYGTNAFTYYNWEPTGPSPYYPYGEVCSSSSSSSSSLSSALVYNPVYAGTCAEYMSELPEGDCSKNSYDEGVDYINAVANFKSNELEKITFVGNENVYVDKDNAYSWEQLSDAISACNYDVQVYDNFCCRKIAGTSSFSNHAEGNAIDINVPKNPYTSERSCISNDCDMSSCVLQAIKDNGFYWGGAWGIPCDAHHIEYRDGTSNVNDVNFCNVA